MDFISVIIPAFNAERWLEDTLQSVKEAIDGDCEVIIVNDGSTDETHNIASRFVDADPRFVLIDIDHVGPCAARKAGFLESQGDYIMFVDSDDRLPADSIREQRLLTMTGEGNDSDPNAEINLTDGRPLIIVANTVARTVTSTGTVDRLLISGQTRALTGMEYAREILSRKLPGFLQGHFYARRLVEAIEWDDSPLITHQENFYLLFSFAMKLNEWDPSKKSVLVIPSFVGYYYVRRAGSQSALMALTLKGLEKVWKHINALGLPEPELTLWGLEVLRKVFIERGIPFPSGYFVAADLRKRALALGDALPEELKGTVESLKSLNRRTRIARELARTAGLTSIKPHLSVVIICRNNLSKVHRSVASVFGMGFRNLEVVLVEMDNSQDDRIAINEMCINYPRVRVVHAPQGSTVYEAATLGLMAAEGLSVTYLRPSDLCCAAGLYEAVTRIDYGADAVMPNYCDFSPTTHIRGKIHSYAYLRSTEEARLAEQSASSATEDVYDNVVSILNGNDEEDFKNHFFIFGIVWRTDFLQANVPAPEFFNNLKSHTLSHAFLQYLTSRVKFRIVTQNRNTPPAFEFANVNFFKKLFYSSKIYRHKYQEGTPTTYNR